MGTLIEDGYGINEGPEEVARVLLQYNADRKRPDAIESFETDRRVLSEIDNVIEIANDAVDGLSERNRRLFGININFHENLLVYSATRAVLQRRITTTETMKGIMLRQYRQISELPIKFFAIYRLRTLSTNRQILEDAIWCLTEHIREYLVEDMYSHDDKSDYNETSLVAISYEEELIKSKTKIGIIMLGNELENLLHIGMNDTAIKEFEKSVKSFSESVIRRLI